MEATAERKAFYSRLRAMNAAPLWEVLSDIVRTDPRTAVQPALWHYDDLRPFIAEAGRLVTAEEAERRVLILENPGLPGMSRITQSLYAGLQLILPGEVAHSHRHSASALRFVLEGSGAYTSVNDERLTMEPGDVILTPFWSFHAHGNPGSEPVVWLDGLDIPTVNMFDTSFFERHEEHEAHLNHEEHENKQEHFKYPYAPHREALGMMARSGAVDLRHGFKREYLSPETGRSVLPTIGAWLQLLPRGFAGSPYRSTDATIVCAVEGHGTSTVGGRTFTWGPRDIFVVPSWHAVSHQADEESVLFSFSDRPAQKSLGIWREDRQA
ncbi:MAG TPA: cupin domain-containing protein [Vicinamibacterales bacterium]|nr:cupin domain-containing protein [Vicinamibacterales bacterium]